MKYPTRIVMLSCLAVLAASCGGDDDTADTPADNAVSDTAGDVEEPIDAGPEATTAPDVPTTAGSVCSLATNEQISEIVANPVTGIDIDATLCEFSLDDGAPGIDGTTVDVFVNAAFDEVCSLEFDTTGATNATVVDDIGSRAAWAPGAQTPQLFICTGSSFVTITQYQPSSVEDDEARSRAEAIAEIVLGRL